MLARHTDCASPSSAMVLNWASGDDVFNDMTRTMLSAPATAAKSTCADPSSRGGMSNATTSTPRLCFFTSPNMPAASSSKYTRSPPSNATSTCRAFAAAATTVFFDGGFQRTTRLDSPTRCRNATQCTRTPSTINQQRTRKKPHEDRRRGASEERRRRVRTRITWTPAG